jgi:nitroimidazol reductase NimA-like FMN-containing flavoprotein (pyridoxamine 5'-phosphate oxidase superfamily)
MSGVPLEPALDAMSAEECRDLLSTVPIGRVVLSIDALPAALPVNYWLIDDAIVFRSPLVPS